MRNIKKLFLFTVVTMMLYACNKEENGTQQLLLGRWYVVNDNVYHKTKYSDSYKKYIELRNDMTYNWDSLEQKFPLNIRYGYWDISATKYFWQYQYFNGNIDYNTVSYTLLNDVIHVSDAQWKIISLSKQYMILEYHDTIYYHDDRNVQRVAKTKFSHFEFSRNEVFNELNGDVQSKPQKLVVAFSEEQRHRRGGNGTITYMNDNF